MIRTFLHLLRPVSVCVILTPLVSGCEDSDRDPLAMAVAPETHGAMVLSDGLPTVSDLVELHGLKGQVEGELEAWWRSWELGPEAGKEVRASVYPTVSQVLYPHLLDPGIRDLLTQNEESLRAAHSVELLLVAESVEKAMDEAWRYHTEAVAALGRGMPEAALNLALHSADAVRGISPEQVARALILTAEESLRRFGPAAPYSEEELTRIRRLTKGAEEALEAEDYPRAIRRAYYACQLLGADPG